jgi:hypothetical protein
VGVVTAAAVLGERITTDHLVGGLIIIGGLVIIVGFGTPKKQPVRTCRSPGTP